MGTLNPEVVDRYVDAWHDVSLDDTNRAVAEECSLYCAEIDALSGPWTSTTSRATSAMPGPAVEDGAERRDERPPPSPDAL